MNYLTLILLQIMEERFADKKAYLAEQKKILKKHKNKYDALNFLVASDQTTKQMFSERTDLTIEDISQLKEMWWKI